MKDNNYLPKQIESILNKQKYLLNTVGMSNSIVRIYQDYVLKIEPKNSETDNVYNITKWLDGRLPVPDIICYVVEENKAYTLMNKIKGKMLCSNEYLSNPELLIKLAAQGLKQLQSININNCPYKESLLTRRLEIAEYNVNHKLVDINLESFIKNGFNNPAELLDWLKNNRPEEDLVFSHGDYCLPNIFVENDSISGFIDIGKMGPADKWQDISLALRSLRNNFNGTYTDGKKIYDFKDEIFLKEIGIDLDYQKYHYYLLLDELF